MAYAAGAAHFHRLPALRSVFRSLIQKLITIMLHPDVWTYWFNNSLSGKALDPDLKELRKPWVDPVCKENVMYSGHVLLMTSLYSMLFAEDRYDKEDSIVFGWNPMFWGLGPEKFSYTKTKLQEIIYKQMERSGWIGACCEPNMVFIVCNQFPIIATRYNDILNNTNIAGYVVKSYEKAWTDRGLLGEDGLFRDFYLVNQDRFADGSEFSHTAWASAFMSWNYSQVKSMYPSVGDGYLEHIDDRINIRSPTLANAIKRIAAKNDQDCETPSVVEQARKETKNLPPHNKRHLLPMFGHVAQWLSEIAGPSDLDALLRHADKYLNPSWSKGGLYYARNDASWDEEGTYVHMKAYMGNTAIGYARLNVPGGQKTMYDRPWAKEEVNNRPCIEGVGLELGADFVRGLWVEEKKCMVTTMRSWEGKEVDVGLVVKMLPVGRWGIYVDEKLEKEVEVGKKGEDVTFEVKLGEEDVDVVVVDLADD